MGNKLEIQAPLKSGLLLEICKDPAEFFKEMCDDLYTLTDAILVDTPHLNEEVSSAIFEYFQEKFNV